MKYRAVSDKDWFAIREAARRRAWSEVEERAVDLGWLILAKHARRAEADFDSLRAVVWGLQLDQPDTADPFADEGDRRGA
jgi:hypothetical protein